MEREQLRSSRPVAVRKSILTVEIVILVVKIFWVCFNVSLIF